MGCKDAAQKERGMGSGDLGFTCHFVEFGVDISHH